MRSPMSKPRRRPLPPTSRRRKVTRTALLLPAALLLASCGPNDTDPGPGGVTVGEARALDEAAEMLDEQRLPAEALPVPAQTSTPEPAETPETAPTT